MFLVHIMLSVWAVGLPILERDCLQNKSLPSGKWTQVEYGRRNRPQTCFLFHLCFECVPNLQANLLPPLTNYNMQLSNWPP